MKETIEFKGVKAQITVRKPRSKNDWVTVTYPCGEQRRYGDMSIYNKFGSQIDHIKHLQKCKACHVVLGLREA